MSKFNIFLIILLFSSCTKQSDSDKNSQNKSKRTKSGLLKYKTENSTIETKRFGRANLPDYPRNHHHSALPMKGDKEPVKIPDQFKNLKLVFPKNICGDITKKIMYCEISRITLKYSGMEPFIKSKTTYIRMKFAKKMNKYIDHCKTVVKPLNKTKIRNCLKLECKKMDQCMKSLTGLKKNTGQK